MGVRVKVVASLLCAIVLFSAAVEARTGAPMSLEHRRRMAAHPEGGRHRVKALIAVLVRDYV